METQDKVESSVNDPVATAPRFCSGVDCVTTVVSSLGVCGELHEVELLETPHRKKNLDQSELKRTMVRELALKASAYTGVET